MESRIYKLIALMVISLTVAVISLPLAAGAAGPAVWRVLDPVTEVVKTPVRVAVTSDGGFYVTDPRNGGVLRYDAAGKLIQVIKTTGSPQGVAVMLDKNLVVTQGSTVVVIDRVTGVQIKQIGAGFGFADGVAVDTVGSIYIVDSKKCTVSKFGADGSVQTGFGTNGVIGSVGVGIGQFMLPGGIAFEKSSGQIAVADSGVLAGTSATYSSKVQFFNMNSGAYVGAIGSYGSAGALTFTAPQGLAFEYAVGGALSRMYVVDTYNSVVEVIDPAATPPAFLGFIGGYGVDAAKGQLMLPTDCAFDPINKRLVVANGFGRIALYGIDGGTTPSGQNVTPPVLTLNAPYAIVNTSTVQLSGEVNPAGSIVSVVLNGVPAAPSLDVTGTAWTYTLSGLTAGSNNIKVTARNLSPVADSKSASVTYVATGPSLYVKPVPAYVNTPNLQLTGTVDAGSAVQVCTPGCVSAVVTGTTWNYNTPGVSLTPSVATSIIVKATNGGVVTQLPPITTTLDNVAPGVTLSAVSTATTVSGQVQNVTGIVADALSGVASVKVNGAPVEVNNGVFSVPLVGVTSYTVVVLDVAGNITTVGPRTIIYDPSKTIVEVASHSDGAVLATAGQVIKGVTNKINTVTIGGTTVTPVGSGPYNWEIPVTLNNGMNDIQIVVGDGSRAKLTLFLDTVKPAAAVTAPMADKATKDASYSVVGSAAADVALTSSVNGSDPKERLSTDSFPVNFTLPGVYPVKLAASDLTGNVSYTVRNLVYDITPPALTVTPVSLPTSTLSGTVEAGATVDVKYIASNGSLGTVTYTQSLIDPTLNVWNAALASSIDPFTVYVDAKDAAGNTVHKFSTKADGNIDLGGQIGDANDARFCIDMIVTYGPKVTSPILPVQPSPPGFPGFDLRGFAHGDIAPIVNGVSSPDGAIDILDCLLILRKASGLSVVW